MRKPKERWIVYWRGDDGDHKIGHTTAVSEKQAINNVWYRLTAGQLDIVRARMFAKLASEVNRAREAATGQLDLFPQGT